MNPSSSAQPASRLPAGSVLRLLGCSVLALVSASALRAQFTYTTPYAFSTLAGSPAQAAGHADGSGSSALFYYPAGVAVDSAGNVYVADTDNHAIRKITPAGVVSTLAGSATGAHGYLDGSGSSALFDYPTGVAVDSSGNIYVADRSNNVIRKITPAGVVSTLAGSATQAYGYADGAGAGALFNSPAGVAVDGAGNIYVADYNNSAIRKVTPSGQVSTLAGSLTQASGHADGSGSNASFNGPAGVAVDSAGNVYVADYNNNAIRLISPAGNVTTLAGSPAQAAGHTDGSGASFDGPAGVAVDSAGNIYVADQNNNAIRRITPAGLVSTLAGSSSQAHGHSDGAGSSASFYSPKGMAVDGAGNVYVADYNNNTIRWGAALSTPTLTSATTAGGTAGQSFSYTVTFSNYPTSYGATGLPAGLSINSATGVISGTPSAAGTSTVTLSATNGAGTGSGSLTISIAAATLPANSPVQTSATTASGTLGQGFSYTTAFSNSPSSYSAANLPAGLSLDSATGVISGTPSVTGVFIVTLTATNGSGTNSGVLILTIGSGTTPAIPGHLVNLSVRTGAGTGDSTLIVGFVIGGAGTTGTAPLLIRGVGPTLANYGVPGVLADPSLALFISGGTSPIASNDNWGGDAAVAAVGNAVGAFPLASAASKDAALALPLAGGVYSAQITGSGGTSGIALAEIYDASGSTFTATTPRLINVSARAQVGTGSGVLIAGFVIDGNSPCTVLIRGVGPTLANYGVSGVLADPQLSLTQTVNGSTVTVASNDNWSGDASISAAASSVGAFALASASSKDAALLVTLPPGIYSAQVSGVGGTTGVALVEVYEVP